ncbi:coagulation factor IX [Chelmon rostratus]|uniref:coagulation factor IX n=1 Tax=Chelmon rostratus TaxID=109905 RepID=UPI001BE5B7F3|nr:coagulation factor IX [Chelmon rostratus]
MLPSTALATALCTLLTCSAMIECTVFLDRSSSGQILRSSSRRRRANSHFLEEMLPGDLERECYEESCSQEEATEIFQTKEKTLEFWYKYTNLNPCRTNPCKNGGMCTMDRGDFLCLCPPQYHGKTCDSVVLQCHYRNGGCMQYCRDLLGGAGVQCGCSDGFQLEPDGQSCSQTVSFPCGRQQSELLHRSRSLWSHQDQVNITRETMDNSTDSWVTALNLTETQEELRTVNATSDQRGGDETELRGEDGGGEEEGILRIVGGVLEERGGSPWQVLVRRSDGYGFCGGTLVSDQWVVSAAHCLDEAADHVTIGDFDKQRPDPGEQRIKIQRVIIHPHFHSFTFDSDIALLYLARPVVRGPTVVPACLPDPHLSKYLLKEGNRGVVTGWGLTRYLGRSSRFLRKVTLPVVSYKDCTASTEQVITDNMFCAGYLQVSMDACSGDSGGPFVVHYRGTWFLTGVVSWGEKCAAKGKYGVYTRLGNFLNWIRDTMERSDINGTESGDTTSPSSSS